MPIEQRVKWHDPEEEKPPTLDTILLYYKTDAGNEIFKIGYYIANYNDGEEWMGTGKEVQPAKKRLKQPDFWAHLEGPERT